MSWSTLLVETETSCGCEYQETHQWCAETLSLVWRLDPERHKEKTVINTTWPRRSAENKLNKQDIGYVQADKFMNTMTRYCQRASGAFVSLTINDLLVFEGKLVLNKSSYFGSELLRFDNCLCSRMGWCHLSTHTHTHKLKKSKQEEDKALWCSNPPKTLTFSKTHTTGPTTTKTHNNVEKAAFEANTLATASHSQPIICVSCLNFNPEVKWSLYCDSTLSSCES